VSALIPFSPTYAVDRTIFGVAQHAIVKSTDGGASWQAQPSTGIDLHQAAGRSSGTNNRTGN